MRKHIGYEIGAVKQVLEVIEHEQQMAPVKMAEQMCRVVGLASEVEMEGIADP